MHYGSEFNTYVPNHEGILLPAEEENVWWLGHGKYLSVARSRKQGAQSMIIRIQANREVEEKTKRKGGR